jgi:type II secretory pathway pseudopilin PulG
MKRLFFIATPVGASTTERGDILINTIVGLTLTAIVLFVAVPFLLHSIAAGNTAAAEQTMHDLGTSATQYYQDNGQFPISVAVLVTGGYLPNYPTDPQNPANSRAFRVFQTTVNGNAAFYVTDLVAHDQSTLSGLGIFSSVGSEPSGTCGPSGCNTLVYDPLIGIEGSP